MGAGSGELAYGVLAEQFEELPFIKLCNFSYAPSDPRFPIPILRGRTI